MAHQIVAGPSTSGSSKISAPLMTSPRATETKNAAPSLRMADHRHVHNAVNTRDERAAERRQKVFAVDRAHIVPEQIHGHPPRKRKKPDKEQTFRSAPYPAAVSLNSCPPANEGVMPEGRWIVKRCRSKNRAQLTRAKSEHIYPRLAAYTKKLLGLKFTPDEVQIFPVSIAKSESTTYSSCLSSL